MARRLSDAPARIYLEYYACNCVQAFRRVKDQSGYCPTHGQRKTGRETAWKGEAGYTIAQDQLRQQEEHMPATSTKAPTKAAKAPKKAKGGKREASPASDPVARMRESVAAYRAADREAMEAAVALLQPGMRVSWKHGDHIRYGEVIELVGAESLWGYEHAKVRLISEASGRTMMVYIYGILSHMWDIKGW